MRVLFVVPPLVGHVNPTVSIAGALAAAGHEIAWAGHPELIAQLLPRNARVISVGELPSELVASTVAKPVRGLESVQFFWQEFLVPLARSMTPAVERIARELRPDVIVADQQAVGGALAARRLGIPWVTLCTTTGALVEPLAALPKVKEWVNAQLAQLQNDAGLSVQTAGDLSPHLTIVLSTPALAGVREYPPAFRFVGPALTERSEFASFDWEALSPCRRVLVSLGTVSAERGAAFYRAVIDGVCGVQLIVAAPTELVPDPPPHVIVRRRVPQLALLQHVHAVVTHGGHNTVCEALAHGLPLVCAPIRDDQPVIAQQVVDAGAGLRVRFAHPSPSILATAVRRVLDEPSFTAAAQRIRSSFAEAGGARRAAELITAAA